MTIREEMEYLERTYMSPYATLSENTRGRDREEPECDIRRFFSVTGIGSYIVNRSED